jgi:hypothetical protein
MEDGTTLTELDDPDRNWLVSNWVSVRDDATEDVVVTDTYQVGEQRVVGYIRQTAVNSDRYLWIEASVFNVQESLRGSNPEEDVGFTQVVNTGTYDIGDGEENVVMIDARGESGKLLDVYATNEGTLEPIQRAEELRGQDQRARLRISLEDAYHGATRNITLNVTETDDQGRVRQQPRELKVRIPAGVTAGTRTLRSRGSWRSRPWPSLSATFSLMLRVAP